MDIDFYNKLSASYQTLSNRFTDLNKSYQNGYAIYNKEMFQVRDKQFEFLKQFENIPYGTYFNSDYLEKHDTGGAYYTSATLVETDKTINIHAEFSMILFYYLVNELKNDIQIFLDLLESKVFNDKFSGSFKVEKYKLKYSLFQHESVFNFMMGNVANFGLIYHLFHRTNSGFMYATENSMVVRVQGIKDLLEVNNRVYNFQNYRIV